MFVGVVDEIVESGVRNVVHHQVAGALFHIDVHGAVPKDAGVHQHSQPIEEPPKVQQMLLLHLAHLHCEHLTIDAPDTLPHERVGSLSNDFPDVVVCFELVVSPRSAILHGSDSRLAFAHRVGGFALRCEL